MSSIFAVKSLAQRSSSRSPARAPCTGALGVPAKKPLMGGPSSFRTPPHSSDQKPTGICSAGVGSGAAGTSGSGFSGSVRTGSAAFGWAAGAEDAGVKLPVFSCSSTRVSRAFRASASRFSSGRHICTIHSSPSIRRLALRVKPARVVCSKFSIRTSSPLDSFRLSSRVSLSEATPESMGMPLFPAVCTISKSRAMQASSSSMALRSLPSA